jgi:cbb3-type cytochrome oxidase maturation protein
MTSLLILLPVSLVLLGLAVGVLVWAMRHGQFEDLDAASIDPLSDDRAPSSRRTDSDAD